MSCIWQSAMADAAHVCPIIRFIESPVKNKSMGEKTLPGCNPYQRFTFFCHVAQVDNSKDDLAWFGNKKNKSKFLVASCIFGDLLEFSLPFAEFY